MEWLSRTRCAPWLGCALALASVLAVFSFAPQDPTLTNLRFPKDGIGNWLGYPGALAGGTLVEGIGWAAWLLPGAVLYWTLCTTGRPRMWKYGLQTAALLVLAASWTGQWAREPGLGLAGPGLIGWSGGQWTRGTLGPWIGGAVLTLGLGLALWHQFYAPQWRAVLGDVRTLGRLFTREGWRRAAAWAGGQTGRARAVPWGAVGWVLLAPLNAVGLLALGLGHGLRRWVLAPLVRIVEGVRGSAASLRRIKARAAAAKLALRRAPQTAAVESAESGQAFDEWMVSGRIADAVPERILNPVPDRFPADGSPLPGSPASQAGWTSAVPTGAERLALHSRAARDLQPGNEAQPELPPAGGGAERWEQLLRRYRENLDLDWDERSWRAKGEGELNANEEKMPPHRPK